MQSKALIWLGVLLLVPMSGFAQTEESSDRFEPFLERLQAIVETGDRDRFVSLLAPDADPEPGRRFAAAGIRDGVTRAVVQPRLLIARDDVEEATAYEMTLEVFTETGNSGRLQTWTLDLVATPDDSNPTPAWTITRHRSAGGVDGLHHLTLNREKQFDASNLVIAGEDMTLRMSEGAMFVAEINTGIALLVLIGDGTMTFTPEPPAERGQVRIFSGDETLEADFTEALVRVNPEMFASRVSSATLTETPVDQSDLDDAQRLFDELAGLSYVIDLSDLSARQWWLSPGVGDFIAEVRTRRHGTLTYAQARNQPEDVTLYKRNPEYRVISLYASARQRAARGRYFNDQDTMSYDVIDYDIVASFEPRGVSQHSLRARAVPRGCWIDGTARLVIRATSVGLRTVTLRLADELEVRSVTSRELGPLLFFRMQGQNNVIVNLPTEVPIDTELTLNVVYQGLLPGEETDENWIGRATIVEEQQSIFGIGEHRYIYSNSSHWYPQSPIPDYATGTMTLTVPADYGVVASGDPGEGNPPIGPVATDTGPRTYEFVTLQPAKYLSAVISTFWPNEQPPREVAVEVPSISNPIRPGVRYNRVSLSVETNPRTRERVDEYYGRATDIFGFYGSLVGDLPYPVFTLTLTDSYLPGGHSPAYFAVLNQPLPLNPGTIYTWRTDPVAFSDVDYFFLAHELAHQWWGQAVGWKNYHEQWLSEALAHYFAALYVGKDQGDDAFRDVLSQMRDWSLRHSDEGPVYLGYRLGHIENKPRVYRALVYNKGAMVLHMLRRLVGDEVFFRGLRRYYEEMRFQKAGTDDLIRAFETESARSLELFFDRWIHESEVPELRFEYETETGDAPGEVILRFEQGAKLFEIPVTVTLKYRSGEEETAIVVVTDRVTEVRRPLRGRLRDVEVNEDRAALAQIRR